MTEIPKTSWDTIAMTISHRRAHPGVNRLSFYMPSIGRHEIHHIIENNKESTKLLQSLDFLEK